MSSKILEESQDEEEEAVTEVLEPKGTGFHPPSGGPSAQEESAKKPSGSGLRNKISYVGRTSDIVRRLLCEHCEGIIIKSSLRKNMTDDLDLKIKGPKTPCKSIYYLSIEEEKIITRYIGKGKWFWTGFQTKAQAVDFEDYAQFKLRPKYNRNIPSITDTDSKYDGFEALLNSLIKEEEDRSDFINCKGIRDDTKLATDFPQYTYFLYHDKTLVIK